MSLKITKKIIDCSAIPHRPGIYAIRCIPTMEAYVGCSDNMFSRCSSHATQLRRGEGASRKLVERYKKYGHGNFRFEVLEEVEVDGLGLAEMKWFDMEGSVLNTTTKPLRGGHHFVVQVKIVNPEIVKAVMLERAYGLGKTTIHTAELLIMQAIQLRRKSRA